MEPTPEEFEKLRKLLALKRHELPPPGYFDSFSSKVVARIRADEAARPSGVWQRFLAMFSTSPAIAGVFALAMLAFVIAGVNLNRKPGTAATAPVPVSTPAFVSQPAPQSSNAAAAILVNSTAESGVSNSSPPGFLVHPGSVLINPGSSENAETQQVKFPK